MTKQKHSGVFVPPEEQSNRRTVVLRVTVWVIITLVVVALVATLGPALLPQPVTPQGVISP